MKYIKFLIVLVSLAAAGCGNEDNETKIEASGNIEATNVTVSSQVTGRIISLLKDEGASVNAGDTVMIIDHEALDYQLRQAEASTDAAEAQLDLMREGARQEDISQASESVTQASINFNMAKQDLERFEALYKENTVTRKQYDDAVSRFNISQAQLNSSEENLKKLKNLARPQDIKQSKANVNRQSAAVDLLRKQIRDSYIVTPANGIIVKKYFEQGETVTMLSSLFEVSDQRTVDLLIYVSEPELGKVKLGQTVYVTSDTYKDKKYKGKVVYISPEAEFTPKNIQTKDERTKLVFAVKVEINNSAYELKPGMPADAVIYL